MASSVQTQSKRLGRALLPPVLTLAGQRMRKTWSLLLLTELGMLGAVLLTCVVSLYTNITLTASLRYTLNAQSSDIIVSTVPGLVSSSILAQAGQAINKEMTRELGNALESVQFSIQSQPIQMLTANAQGTLHEAGADMSLISEDMHQAAAHLNLVAGSLPEAAGSSELGVLTALFLALLGCLIASWMNMRTRMTGFMALRALGATPRQVTATLAWEQGIIYTSALLLGILVGSLLATLSLPSLILASVLPSQITNDTGSADVYAAQFIPPLQVIIPLSLWLILAALVLICLLVLGVMAFKIAHSPLSMMLRLSED